MLPAMCQGALYKACSNMYNVTGCVRVAYIKPVVTCTMLPAMCQGALYKACSNMYNVTCHVSGWPI